MHTARSLLQLSAVGCQLSSCGVRSGSSVDEGGARGRMCVVIVSSSARRRSKVIRAAAGSHAAELGDDENSKWPESLSALLPRSSNSLDRRRSAKGVGWDTRRGLRRLQVHMRVLLGYRDASGMRSGRTGNLD